VAAAIAGVVGVIALYGLWSTLQGTASDEPSAAAQGSEPLVSELPDYVKTLPEEVALAYQFALDRPDVMLWMPCYCGCGGHSGHKNARDCFIKPASSSGNVQFDEHGSQCNVCVDIAVLAREMTLKGAPLTEIRTAVDQQFGDVGPGTDTPLPPS
jgi:hypothetical protein